MECQCYHLCAGLKAGTNSMVHGVQAIWDENVTTEDWGFLLVDANNTSNEISSVGMLWTVRRLWPSGACFFLNYHRHWSSLVFAGWEWGGQFSA